MPARVVSSPTAVTWTRRAESVETVPATTGSPSERSTGRDSPVMVDSSISAVPCTMTPSAGTRPPTADQHHIAGAEVVEGDRDGLAVGIEALGLVGQQGRERGERALGLADRLHLLPVAQQHDRDQGGELPPELEVEHVEARQHRRHVGDDDRHGDEQHHPGRRDRSSATPPARNGQPPHQNTTEPSTGPSQLMPGKSTV